MLLKQEEYEYKINTVGDNLAEVEITILSTSRKFKGMLPSKINKDGYEDYKLLEKMIYEITHNHHHVKCDYQSQNNIIVFTIYNVIIDDVYAAQIEADLHEYVGIIDENDTDLQRLCLRQKHKIDLMSNKLRSIERKMKEIQEFIIESKL